MRSWKRNAILASGSILFIVVVAKQRQRLRTKRLTTADLPAPSDISSGISGSRLLLDQSRSRTVPEKPAQQSAGERAEACARLLREFNADAVCTGRGDINGAGEMRPKVSTEAEDVLCVLKHRKPLAVVHRSSSQVGSILHLCAQAQVYQQPEQSSGPIIVHREGDEIEAQLSGEALKAIGAWSDSPSHRIDINPLKCSLTSTTPYGSTQTSPSLQESSSSSSSLLSSSLSSPSSLSSSSQVPRSSPSPLTRGFWQGIDQREALDLFIPSSGLKRTLTQIFTSPTASTTHHISELQGHIALGVLLGYPREDIDGMHRLMWRLQQQNQKQQVVEERDGERPKCSSSNVPFVKSATREDDRHFEADWELAMKWMRERERQLRA